MPVAQCRKPDRLQQRRAEPVAYRPHRIANETTNRHETNGLLTRLLGNNVRVRHRLQSRLPLRDNNYRRIPTTTDLEINLQKETRRRALSRLLIKAKP